MPDFERVTDSLRQYLAQTPEEKAFERGYQKGKTRARIEVLIITTSLIVLWSLICLSTP